MTAKRFSRILSLILVTALVLTFLPTVCVCGAEEQEQSDDTGHVIYFNAKVSGWANYSRIMVYCYCYEDADVLIEWGANRKGGMTDIGNGIWSYDFDAKGVTLEDGKQYGLIFLTDVGQQTQELLFDTTCFGDTVIPDEAIDAEIPYEFGKRAIFAYWQSGKLGPTLCITQLGHVIGDICPANTTPSSLFVDFLIKSYPSGLELALRYGDGKSEQELIDEISRGLYLTRTDVEKVIEAAKVLGPDWPYQWNARRSTAFQRGDYDDDHDVTIMDATRVQNLIAENYPKPFAKILIAIDADGDGELTIMDATRIQNVVAYLTDMDGNSLLGYFVDGDHCGKYNTYPDKAL